MDRKVLNAKIITESEEMLSPNGAATAKKLSLVKNFLSLQIKEKLHKDRC